VQGPRVGNGAGAFCLGLFKDVLKQDQTEYASQDMASELENRSGCLGLVLQLFGIGKHQPTEVLPYRKRDDFLSAAEASFYRVLNGVVGERALVFCKVRLADVLFVPRSENFQRHQNRIAQKHVDFLLCDPISFQPIAGIELDDQSHSKSRRVERDSFCKDAFSVAGLPLIQIPAQRSYVSAEIEAALALAFSPPVVTKVEVQSEPEPALSPVDSPTDNSAKTAAPVCPKCGVRMVERIAKKGDNAGKAFFGCVNYPRCRETVI